MTSLMHVVGYASCYLVMGAIAVSCLINAWCLMVLTVLMLDASVGQRYFPENEDKHRKRRKKIKLVK